jgi:hypothetical protein
MMQTTPFTRNKHMKLLNILKIFKKNTVRRLTFKNAARWERIASYSFRTFKRLPEWNGSGCSFCIHYSPVIDEPQKGICKRYAAHSVVLIVRGTDSRNCQEVLAARSYRFVRLRFERAAARKRPWGWVDSFSKKNNPAVVSIMIRSAMKTIERVKYAN